MTDQLLVAEGVRKVYRTGAEEVEALRECRPRRARGRVRLGHGAVGLGQDDPAQLLLGPRRHRRRARDARRRRPARVVAMPNARANRASSMGFIFQAYNLIPVFSAVENVELPSLLAGVDRQGRAAGARRDARAGRARRSGAATGPASCPVVNSSASPSRVRSPGGPRVVWADEPTGALDSDNRRATSCDLLRELNADGLTLIVVTHDEGVGCRARTGCVRMRDGRIVSDERVGDALPRCGPRPDDHRRAAARCRSSTCSFARPILRRLALRNVGAAAAGDHARDPRIAARHRDHDGIVRRRRHVHVVDPAGRVRAARADRRGRVGRRPGRRRGAPLEAGRLPRPRRRRCAPARRSRARPSPPPSTPRRAAPTAQLLETDFAAARRFGGDAERDRHLGRRRRGRERPRSAPTSRARCTSVSATRIEVFAYGVAAPLTRRPRAPEARAWPASGPATNHVRQRVRRARDDRRRSSHAGTPGLGVRSAVDGRRVEPRWCRSRREVVRCGEPGVDRSTRRARSTTSTRPR